MKLSVAIADSTAEPSAFVVWRGFEKSIAKAKAFGFDGVELAMRSKEDITPAALSKMLEKSDMEVSCISTGRVFASLGQYLTNEDETQRMAAVNTMLGLCDFAKDFGRMINIGRARGFYSEKVSRDETERLFLDSLYRIADHAARRDVTVIIEPVNRYEINFINNTDQCAELISRLSCKNVGIMPDVFHMNIEDAHIGKSLLKHRALVRYVHLADSNRYAPGNAHMDFDEIFGALLESRYNDWVSVEILPKPSPDAAAKAAVEFLRPYIARHNASMAE